MDDADVTDLVASRARENKIAEKRGIHLTYMPFVVKAVVAALKQYPYLNSTVDDQHEEIILKKYYNIGIAVDTPDGLIVPVVKSADEKDIFTVAQEIQTLTEKAQSRQIGLSDLKGGTFTITNVGVIGGTHATPIINYPETAILATGRISRNTSCPRRPGRHSKHTAVIAILRSQNHRRSTRSTFRQYVNQILARP